MGKTLVQHAVDDKKAAEDAIRKANRNNQANLNARLDSQRFKNISGSAYDSMTSRDSSTIYLVDRGTYIELYKGDIPISGEGSGLVFENALYTTCLANEGSLPTRFGGEYIGVNYSGGNYSSHGYTRVVDDVPSSYKAFDTDTGQYGRFIYDPSTRGVVINRPGSSSGSIGGSAADGGYSLALTVKRQNGTIETLNYSLYSTGTTCGWDAVGTLQYEKFNVINLGLALNGTKLGSFSQFSTYYDPDNGARGSQIALIPVIDAATGYAGIAASSSSEYYQSGVLHNSSIRFDVFPESSNRPCGLLYDISTGAALSPPKLYGMNANQKAIVEIVSGGDVSVN